METPLGHPNLRGLIVMMGQPIIAHRRGLRSAKVNGATLAAGRSVNMNSAKLMPNRLQTAKATKGIVRRGIRR